MAHPAADPLDRLWSRVSIPDHASGCWIWTGTVSRYGYGRFTLGSKLDSTFRETSPHRFIYEAYRGSVPEGLQIDHLCRERLCVNPDHLEAVTPRVNTLRGRSPAAIHATKTHCKYGHEFTEKNTYQGKSGRDCRECKRIKAIERRALAA